MPESKARGGSPRAFPQIPSRASGAEKEIIRRIREKGPITFAEFMGVALYWPEGGYYTSPDPRWGKAGDYVTNIDISPVFPKVVAKAVHEMWACLGNPAGFELIEPGAGRGWLSKGILSALKDTQPELYGTIRVRLIERNPHLREAPSEKITWHEDISELSPGITGCILSNELIDSFPVHRFIHMDGLMEIYTGCEDGSFIDVPGQPSTEELANYFERGGIALADGQRGEVNLAAEAWIKRAGRLLDRGFVVTIDYGLPGPELYSPERKGTLMCHYRHTPNDNPYINVGEQDITTHADFSALARRGGEAGLEVTGFTTQKNFLLGMGILEEMEEPARLDLANYDKIKGNQLIKELILPGGMGDTFKVLVQHKGLRDKPSLKGFSFRDLTKYL